MQEKQKPRASWAARGVKNRQFKLVHLYRDKLKTSSKFPHNSRGVSDHPWTDENTIRHAYGYKCPCNAAAARRYHARQKRRKAVPE
jgi:hypothetical protein